MSDFKYVPVEPTPEMLDEGLNRLNTWGFNSPEEIYSAMLAAAPTQPSPAESDKELVRNSVLEDIAAFIGGHIWGGSPEHVGALIAKHVRAMKSTSVSEVDGNESDLSQPAQPSDSHPTIAARVDIHPHDASKTIITPMLDFETTDIGKKLFIIEPSDSRTEFSDTEILNWLFDQQESTNDKTVRENVIEAMQADREGS